MGFFGGSSKKSTAGAKSTSKSTTKYVAPATTRPPTGTNASLEGGSYVAGPPAGLVVEHRKVEEDPVMVPDRAPVVPPPAYTDLEDPSKSYSRDEYVERETDASRQNHLNSLFNGHLMKWKFEAEEGSPFVRVPAFFGALGLIGSDVWALVTEDDAWTSHSIVMCVCVITMAIFVLILDGRFLSTNPLSARAHLRNVMTRNFNIFRFVWGRGLLYMIAGTLNVAQLWLPTIISGGFMIGVGFLALMIGIYASRKFAALRNSLADESFLLLVFSNYDVDGDGYVVPHEFASLLTDLGMELDDRYTLKAFNVIDTDNDRRISFEEFSHWWASGYIERGRVRRENMMYEDDYHRMS